MAESQQDKPWAHRASAISSESQKPPELNLVDYRQYVESGQLFPVTERLPLRRYISETWLRRHYIWADSRARVQTRNSGHRLGSWWLVIKPVTDVIFYWVLFGLILKASRGLPNYTAYIIIGVLMFQYFSRIINASAAVMRQNKAMMKAFSFPRVSIPISLTVREALSMGPVLCVMLVGIVILPPHAYPALSWFLLLPALTLVAVFNLGVSMVIARVAAIVPDVQPVLGILTRILFYGSGVIFPITRFINHPAVTEVIQVNPIYIFLDLLREILIYGHSGTEYHWVSLSIWSAVFLLVGFLFFYRGEGRYGRES